MVRPGRLVLFLVVLALLLIARGLYGAPPPTPTRPGPAPDLEALRELWGDSPEALESYAEDEDMEGVPEFVRRAVLGEKAPAAPPRSPTVEELTREIVPRISARKFAEVEARLRAVIETEEKTYGKDWPDIGAYRKLLADFLERRGRRGEAEALLLVNLGGHAGSRFRYYKCAPLLDLATHYRRGERFAKARSTLAEARASLADAPPEGALRWTARLDGFEAELAYATGDLPRALTLAAQALAADTRSKAHPGELFGLEILLTTLEIRAKKLGDARRHLALAKSRVPPGLGHPGGMMVGMVEADLWVSEGRPQAALDFLNKNLLLVPQLDPWGAGFTPYRHVMGRAFAAARRFKEAETQFRDLLAFEVPGCVNRVPLLEDLAACQQAAGKRAEAMKTRRELEAAKAGKP